MQKQNNNSSSKPTTYEIRKGPGTRNIPTPSVSKLTKNQPPEPKNK
ncbi:hypothetical protein [Romboutsia ilealis]|nr:hypothetical protein [Romboutsia ilealis]